MPEHATPAAGSTLADRIERLLAALPERPSYDEVARVINERRGAQTISKQYLWQLATGRKTNPTMRHLEAISEYFGVSPAHFFDEEPRDREHPPVDPARFADRLSHLFEQVHPAAGPYSSAEVAAALPAVGAEEVDALRAGRSPQPSPDVVEALAGFFGVRPAYFTDDAVAEATNRELALAVALRDAKVRLVALRSAALDPPALEAVQNVIEAFLRRPDEGRIER